MGTASKFAFELAIGLAERWRASVVALHAWQSPVYMTSSMFLAAPAGPALSVESYIESEAQAALQDFLEPYRDRGTVHLASRLGIGS